MQNSVQYEETETVICLPEHTGPGVPLGELRIIILTHIQLAYPRNSPKNFVKVDLQIFSIKFDDLKIKQPRGKI